MTQEYIGTLTALTQTGRTYGFIGRDTIKLAEDDRRAAFTSDVFLHQEDCPGKLEVGQHYRFQVEPAPRKGKFRATAVVYAGSKGEDHARLALLCLWALTSIGMALAGFLIIKNVEFIGVLVLSTFAGLLVAYPIMGLAKLVFGWRFNVMHLLH